MLLAHLIEYNNNYNIDVKANCRFCASTWLEGS